MLIPDAISDQFGRKHNYLRISVTERCNLRCFYCMPPEGVKLSPKINIMTSNEIIGIAKEFVDLGINKIRLTGGEPLVRKDIATIIKGLSDLNIQLAISTNGVILDEYIDLLNDCNAKSINISLDTLKQNKFNKITYRNYFYRVQKNIEDAILRGFKIKINVVLIKGTNDDEIVDFIELTKNWPVSIRFIEFMPFDGNNWNWDKGISKGEILNQASIRFSSKLTKINDEPNDTSKNYKVEGYAGRFGIISTVTNPFCDSCNRIRLTANGRIKNCLFSQSETDLLSAFRSNSAIKPLILDAVYNKKKLRGGMDSFSDFSNPKLFLKNRSMVAIGG